MKYYPNETQLKYTINKRTLLNPCTPVEAQ